MSLVLGAALTACTGTSAGSSESQTPASQVSSVPPATVTLRQTVTQLSTVTVTPTSAAPVAPGAVEIGTKTASGGIEMTVSAMTNVPSYTTTYNRDETVIQPRAGGKLIQVQAAVLNNTTSSIDLTCGYPVAAKLIDSDKRQFDPVDELYKLPDNPACNYQLQPGFDSPMTWIYEVPTAAKILYFAFQDTDLKNTQPNDPAWAATNAPAGL